MTLIKIHLSGQRPKFQIYLCGDPKFVIMKIIFCFRALLDTNPYLLGLTIIVSIVHSVFEFLAFKNDIQFWRTRESLEGLSVRSVFFNVFQSLIVVLYVLDNETNTVVQISCGIGLLIEMWKITKVVHVTFSTEAMTWGE